MDKKETEIELMKKESEIKTNLYIITNKNNLY